MAKPADYQGQEANTWCPNCGDHAILTALKMALAELGLPQHNTVVVSGIGCSGKIPHYLNTYGFEGVHGRVLPAATGIKLANHDLTVIGIGGDGDGYGIGLNHLMHTMRRNLDLTYIVHDNQIYGLTKGQASPTSEQHIVSPSTPDGVIEQPVNPMALAITGGATFVARGFTRNLIELRDLMVAGIKHRGFALIDVLQPCVTYNHHNTYSWYQERVYQLPKDEYQPTDRHQAWLKAQEMGQRIPLGVFYQEQRPCYEDEVVALKKGPLVKQDVSTQDISQLISALK